MSVPVENTDQQWRHEPTPAQYDVLHKKAPSPRSPEASSTARRSLVPLRGA